MFDIETKTIEPMTVAYVPMRGPYSQFEAGYDTLFFLVGASSYTQIGPPIGVFMSDPSEGEENAVWELWVPIEDIGVELEPSQAHLGIKRVPETVVASSTYTGRFEELGAVYDALFAWAAENGRAIVGPPQEVYLTDAEQVDPTDNITEVRFPIDAAVDAE